MFIFCRRSRRVSPGGFALPVTSAEKRHSAPCHPAGYAIRTAQSAEAKEAEGSSGAPFALPHGVTSAENVNR